MWLTPENELIDISKSELFLARTIKERNKKDITLHISNITLKS